MKIEHFCVDDFREGTEFYTAVMKNEQIDAKCLSFDEKVELLRECFKHEELTNPSLILNVMLLSEGGNFEDDFFEIPSVMFESLVDYIDIKQELKSEVSKFNEQLAKYFIGVIKGYSIKFDELKEDMTNIYWHTINASDFAKLSKIVAKAKFDVSEVPAIKNAEYIIDGLCSRNEMVKVFMKMFTTKE